MREKMVRLPSALYECSKCNQVKPGSCFHTGVCDDCQKERKRQYEIANNKRVQEARRFCLEQARAALEKPLPVREKEPLIYKVCEECGENKLIEAFPLIPIMKRRKGEIYKSQCKECARNSDRRRKLRRQQILQQERETLTIELDFHERAAIALRERLEKYAKVTYGLQIDHYDEMLASQKGLCAICGGPPPAHTRLVIDHSHQTGMVRGLLCNRCNVGLGFFRENQSSLANAIQYLQKSQWEI